MEICPYNLAQSHDPSKVSNLPFTLLHFYLIFMGLSCSVYGEPIPVKELADRVASYVHLCTLYWWLRFDETNPVVSIHFYFFLIIILGGITDGAADLLDAELFLVAMTEMDHNFTLLNPQAFHM